MFIEKLDAVIIHKFIKENLDETVTTVDLRDSKIDNFNKRKGLIYSKTKQGLAPNFILFDDKTFCISTSNHSNSKLIQNLTNTKINELWQEFLTKKFGTEYTEFMSDIKIV